MYKSLLVLPDGTEISSGTGTKNAIRSTKFTQIVNSGEELTIGSACSNMIEATLFTPGGDLSITSGDEIIYYRVNDSGVRTKIGLFAVEEPTHPTANTMKIVGYDRVSKLDKDLSSWLQSLGGWPYSVNTFASMVCQACGVTFVEQSGLPNGDFSIHPWMKTGATGRQIMRWLGEIVCRYVYADPDGNIHFGWYKDSGKSYGPAGENYFFAGSLSYENYMVFPVEAVQIRLADNDNGAVWPQLIDGTNSYIITGNPILTAYVTEDLQQYLDVIARELARVTYTPCELSVPAALDVNAGDIVQITDKNGKTLSAYVMSKITSGQRDTLSGTGSQRRDGIEATNNKTDAERQADLEAAANSAGNAAATNKVGELDKALNQAGIFNRLTNNGLSQGLFMLNGDLYINASYLVTGILRSKDGTTFYLDLDKGILRGKFEEFTISGKTVDDIAQEKADAAEDNAVGQASDLADAAAKNAEKNALEELNNYAATVSKEIEGLQSQIDKNITTWFGDYVPQRINSPAIGWIGLGKEEQHQGDLFYVVDNEKHGGKVYRWVPIDDIYEWRLIEDTELAKALADAAKAQDTADGKRRVFVDEPVPPYDVGDLWAQGSGGDLMRCVTARESGSYDAADWDLASKYIDAESAGSIAQDKVDSQTQEDIFNKLTNNGQEQGIYILDGLVYINATYIKSGKIVSEGMAYLPPTYDDCIDMLMSLSFPDRYPPKDFYDINGDGVFDVEDVRLANMVYLGKIKMADCAGAVATAVTVTIDPFNAEETVVLSGINAWGKQISMSLGVTRSKIPHIDGDCAVSGRLSVGGQLVASSLALAIGETPKTLSWKDNGDGTFTLIGQ